MQKLVDIALANSEIAKSIDDLSAKVDRLAVLFESFRLQAISDLARMTPSFNPASALGFNGEDGNRVYRGFIGDERPWSSSPAPIPFTSTLCQQVHFSLDQFRFWTQAMKGRPRYHRKDWEFVYIAQALHERGMLASGRRGLGFGVGQEPLPALFASFGSQVVASEQTLASAIRAGWAHADENRWDLGGLNLRGICTDAMFRELVAFEEVDMNAIDPKFNNQLDFCWSSCSLEHLGSLEHGLQFINNSMKVLKPGGVAVHTTEFNLSSNDATIEEQNLSIYRRRDIDRLLVELAADGHSPSPIDYHQGEGFAETVVDLPPFSGRGEPHLRLRVAEFDCTSVGVVIQRNH